MLKEVRFQNFRCFKDLKLTDLKRFNLIGGKNNVGKTALLEGLFLTAGPTKTDLTDILNIIRSILFEPNAEDFWGHLIYTFDLKKTISLEFLDYENYKRQMKISLVPSDFIKIRDDKDKKSGIKPEHFLQSNHNKQYILHYTYIDEKGISYEAKAEVEKETIKFEKPNTDNIYEMVFMGAGFRPDPKKAAERLSSLYIKKEKESLLEAIKIIEPKITDLLPLSKEHGHSIYCEMGFKKLVPIQISGLGTQKLLEMFIYIATSREGILLLDEIEDGFHYSIMEKIIESLHKFAELYNVQIFATTHSRECIEAAHNVFSKIPDYPFKYIRLDEINGEIVPKEYDKEIMEASFEVNFEVR